MCIISIFRPSTTDLRGHSLKMYKERARLDIRKFSFSNRIVDEWNNLTEEIVQCQTVNNFKNKIDYHLRDIRGFK
jgi:ribonuclease P/MRP protein subunit RPP40